MAKHSTLILSILAALTLLLALGGDVARAQTTAFTYQGRLTSNNLAATGNFDFEFRLFDLLSGGAQQGTTQTVTNVAVDKGVFTVQLDFGACVSCFNGAARFLDITVRQSGGGAFTPLSPRQPVTSTPYAVKSANAATADGLSLACVSCITSGQIQSVSGSAVTGMIPVASVPAGSANYIQSSPATPQSGVGFDIYSGHFNGGVRIEGLGFIVPDTPSLSLASTCSVQVDAPFLPGGRFTILENGNVGIGNGAPTEKFYVAGNGLFTGNLMVNSNINVSGQGAVGGNLGVGTSSPVDKLQIIRGTADLRFGAPNGADGMEIRSGTSPAIYLTHTGTGGRTYRITSYGDNYAPPGSFIIRDETGEAVDRLTISKDGSFRFRHSSARQETGRLSFEDQSNFFLFGISRFSGVSTEVSNSLINFGINTGREGTFDTTNPGFWLRTDIRSGTRGFHFIKKAQTSGTESELMTIDESGNVGIGVLGPTSRLDVGGIITMRTLGSGGGTSLCMNPSFQIAVCSSSLRYKSNIKNFRFGLDLVRRLRPVTFNWKVDGKRDFGLVTEEVAKVEPLLVTHNDRGEIEGVKYDRLGVVLINVIQEQQAQLEEQHQQVSRQAEQIKTQQQEIAALKKLVCLDHPEAEMCKP